MSELMDQAVLNMPYELAMSDELSRMQFWSRAQLVYKEKIARIEADEAILKDALSFVESCIERRADFSKGVFLANCIRQRLASKP